jgi:tripartite ATP-independent transporter DctP family solute receptor
MFSFALISSCREADAAELKLRFGSIYADETPMGRAVATFAKLVAERTNGEIVINHFPAEQLGTEQEMVESTGMGAIDLTAPGSALCGLFQPQYLIFPLCYVIDDWEHLDRVMTSELGKEMADKFLKVTGARVLASNWYREPRYLYGSKPVRKLDDLKGFRVRVPENPSWVKSWQKLGASPTPMALGEVYTGIQTGALDGAETTISYYTSNGINNVAPYFMLTTHVFEANLVLINERLFQSFSPEYQKILTDAAFEAGVAHQQYVKEAIDAGIKKILDEGGEVIEVDRDNWIKRMEGVGYELSDVWKDATLYDRIRAFSDKK